MNTLNYKGYIARIDADLDDGILVGRVINICDIIGFNSEIAAAAVKTGKSLNQSVIDALEKATHAS